MSVGVETQTSAARVHPSVAAFPITARGAVAHWARAVRPRPGGAVLSKVVRPKSAAPVSLAGFYPPAAAADPGTAVESQTSEQHYDNRKTYVSAACG